MICLCTDHSELLFNMTFLTVCCYIEFSISCNSGCGHSGFCVQGQGYGYGKDFVCLVFVNGIVLLVTADQRRSWYCDEYYTQ